VKPLQPPATATWLLELFGPQHNAEVLAGDLLEEFGHGRSRGWYWRQVLEAIRWRRQLINFLLAIGYACFVSVSAGSGAPASRLFQAVAVATALLLVSYVPALLYDWMARGGLFATIAKGAGLLLVVVLTTNFLANRYWGILNNLYAAGSMALVILMSNLAFGGRPRRPPFKMTYRELLFGDPQAERSRLISQLEQTASGETDPERQQAYALSLEALRHKSGESSRADEAP
jgi:hypothetical protein